jgi:Ser/Thr protein kinase RdoA (MazF antagonist)
MRPSWSAVPRRYRDVLDRIATELARVMRRLGTGPDAFGLIHADLEPSNVVFAGGHASPIDFDDCGHGYWAYDVAAALVAWRASRRWPAVRDAFLSGYTSLRPAPRGIEDLDLFMAGRHVAMALWALSRAPRHPGIRGGLSGRFRSVDRFARSMPRPGMAP